MFSNMSLQLSILDLFNNSIQLDPSKLNQYKLSKETSHLSVQTTGEKNEGSDLAVKAWLRYPQKAN